MRVDRPGGAGAGDGAGARVRKGKGWLRALMQVLLCGVAATLLLAPIYAFDGFGPARAVAAAGVMAMPGAFLLWGALRFCRSLHRADRSGSALVAAHAVATITFAIAWTVVIYLLVRLTNPAAAWQFLTKWAAWQMLEGILLYAATAGTAQAIWTRQRLAEQRLATTRAELHALRAQLSPHFLFNSLNSMIQLAEEDPAATQAALLQLAELLRHVTRGGSDDPGEVALEDELAFIRHYLALERLRLGERLRIVEEIDPETLELSIPSFLLQPLVENAVQHGIAPRRSGGTLRLSASLEGNRLLLAVSDDGAGCGADAWRGRQGLGLDIVRRQLDVRFPQQSEMTIETAPGEGFSVRILLPATVGVKAP